jgi:hypothetical protein
MNQAGLPPGIAFEQLKSTVSDSAYRCAAALRSRSLAFQPVAERTSSSRSPGRRGSAVGGSVLRRTWTPSAQLCGRLRPLPGSSGSQPPHGATYHWASLTPAKQTTGIANRRGRVHGNSLLRSSCRRVEDHRRHPDAERHGLTRHWSRRRSGWLCGALLGRGRPYWRRAGDAGQPDPLVGDEL